MDLGIKTEFKCDQCSSICARKTDLRIHIQNFHTPMKPLVCELCSKSFPDRHQYRVIININLYDIK